MWKNAKTRGRTPRTEILLINSGKNPGFYSEKKRKKKKEKSFLSGSKVQSGPLTRVESKGQWTDLLDKDFDPR